ncbi:hypothetical protein [Dactylosporangium sp. NPDC005555]|uniref:hypothetical protein n=1 Tax=Dactylosporangium sp. NPDC005555 TaxID=3154889 RepID=UPI0033A7B3C8
MAARVAAGAGPVVAEPVRSSPQRSHPAGVPWTAAPQPIPGTSRLAHLEENGAAAAVTLSEADLADL